MIYGRQRGRDRDCVGDRGRGHAAQRGRAKIQIDGVSVAIFLRLGNRGRVYEPGGAKPDVGRFSHVTLSEITATNMSDIGCSITGLPGHPVEAVTPERHHDQVRRRGTKEQTARAIPEREDAYPESTMFGTLPAYGFFCRHAGNLAFRNVKLHTAQPDLRHAMVFDDVEDLRIEGTGGPAGRRRGLHPVRRPRRRPSRQSPVTADPPPGRHE